MSKPTLTHATLHDGTIAETVSRLMGVGGTEWEALDGTPFVELCQRYGAEVEQEYDRPSTRYRYVFPDGSAIVEAGCAWAIEGDEPYRWKDDGNHTKSDEE